MSSTKPKPYVFVLMPFSDKFDDIYLLGIKSACNDAGAYCERVDEQIFQESILERIYNQIAKADIIIADMTGRNPNVFYETGYAHALGKRVILLTQDHDDIPFDLMHYPHIIYAGKISQLKSDLEKRIRWYVDNPEQNPSRIEFDLEIFIEGKSLSEHPEIPCGWGVRDESDRAISLKIDIYNPSMKLYDGVATLGIIAPYISRHVSGVKVIKLPDERYLQLLGDIPRILPRSWESLSLDLFAGYGYGKSKTVNAVVVVYTEIGSKEFPVVLKVRAIPVVHH